MHHIAVDNVDKFSLSDAMPVCSTLHSPAPISDTALTLTVYSVPASCPVRRVEVPGGEPEMAWALFQDVVPLLLYSTWYWEMATSLWGGVQVTLRASAWDFTVLFKAILLTLEGAVQEVKYGSIPLIYKYIAMSSDVQVQQIQPRGWCVGAVLMTHQYNSEIT